MAKDKIIIAQLDIDTAALGKSMQDTQKQIEDLEKKQDKLIKKGKESSDKFRENEDDIKNLTASLQAQQAVLNAHVQAMAAGGKSFNDYRQQVASAFGEINILNGGLGGFISRAQQAGGVGPLLSGAFSSMTAGIKGMGAAIMANPVGAAMQAILLVVQGLHNVFKNFTPVVNAVEQGMAAMGAIVESVKNSIIGLLTGATSLGDFFSSFAGSAAEAATEAASLKKAQQELKEEMQAQEIANEEAAKQIDELILRSKDMSLSEKERAKAIQDATNLQKTNYDKRMEMANEAYNQSVRQIAVGKNLTDQEIAQLKKGGVAYAQELAKRKNISDEEIAALKNALSKKIEIEREGIARKQKLRDDEAAADAKREADAQKLRDDAEKKQQERERKRKAALDAAAEKLDLELQKFIQTEGEKAKTLEQSLQYEKEIMNQRLAIAAAEFNASEKTANDRRKMELEQQEAKIGYMKSSADTTAKFAKAELDLWLQNNQTLIKKGEELTTSILSQEEKRLDSEKQKRADLLALEYKTNSDIIADKQAKNEELTLEETNYLTQKTALNQEYNKKIQDNKDAFDAQIKARDVAQANADNQIKLANAQTKYDEDIINEQIRFDEDMVRLDEQLKKKDITQQQYDDLKAIRAKEHAEKEKKINEAKETAIREQYATSFGQVAQLLGKKTVAGKAAAIAEATMNTYNGITQVWAADSILPEPIATIMKGVSTAVVVASGLSAVSKIKSTNTPKAEKGALFSIGGKRHSAGGTLFTGADGTQFEAEQGELIGVMNRNAARHFMAFNNAFPAGGAAAPNYFAGGGIVSREIASPSMNTDELAAKIAEANRSLPAPVVAVQDIITEGNSYVKVRDGANF
jgi:hypothetical protein